MVTEAMDVNTDPNFCRARDIDMAIGSSTGPDVIMVPGGSTVHPANHGPGGSVELRYQHGLRFAQNPDPWHPCDLWW